MAEDQEAHHRPADQQDRGLADLHPCRRVHAADRNIGGHEHADADDCKWIGDTEQEPDDLARADHLRNQIQRHHHERSGGGREAHRASLEAIGRPPSAKV